MKNEDVSRLKTWFLKTKRDFPFRRDPSPYRVWISEVMLQQTRASVVIEYFERWMKKFPTLAVLAEATEDGVIKMWEGLGYYNRARNILRAARYFVSVHGGQIPSDKQALMLVPGLGPYTSGAILSFAFKKKAPAIDANVLRVMSRYYCIEELITKAKVQKDIFQLVDTFLPEEDPHIVMEALIELGATICTKAPRCSLCPANEGCIARQRGLADALPLKSRQKQTVYLERDVAVVFCQEKFLVKKMQPGKVLGGLFEFLSFDCDGLHTIESHLNSLFGEELVLLRELTKEHYSYTHHNVELFPSIWETRCEKLIEGCEWVSFDQLKTLPFSAGHRRILAALFKEKIL